MLLPIADEVARNGVLQRITSARGFLGHPLQFAANSALPLAAIPYNVRPQFAQPSRLRLC